MHEHSNSTLLALHEAFTAFNEALSTDAACWEASKSKLQQLQAGYQAKGLLGPQALTVIAQFRQQINWEGMAPDQFSRFYRFVYHLCRDPCRRNIHTDVAVDAWRLVLRGRFRLLERWCCFVEAGQKSIITEDTWRQVLDFARAIHEDLGNYDPTGAWAVLLDEFVEEMRGQRRGGGSGAMQMQLDLDVLGSSHHHQQHSGGLQGGGSSGASGGASAQLMSAMSPRCGSKRRGGADVDVVAEQLAYMDMVHVHQQQQQQQQGAEAGAGGMLDDAMQPATSSSGQPPQRAGCSTPKRVCVERPGQLAAAMAGLLPAGGPQGPGAAGGGGGGGGGIGIGLGADDMMGTMTPAGSAAAAAAAGHQPCPALHDFQQQQHLGSASAASVGGLMGLHHMDSLSQESGGSRRTLRIRRAPAPAGVPESIVRSSVTDALGF